jgi:ATP-dependent DNA helicase RecQ
MPDYQSILRRYWGYPSFRGIQKDIIESIGSGKDTLGLMPTGGGKSITFQVPALAQNGVCIVITPLISLMKDQVDHLRHKNIPAGAIYSGMTREEIVRTLENAVYGGLKLLYISPERLSSELFQTKIKHMQVSFITVDEAHCISQWGYDFRPSYLHVADIREIIPNVPILALTATATPKVIDDIQDKLHFREKNVHRMSFARKNLAYIVRKTSDKNAELIHILKSTHGSAIVYTRSRKQTKDVAQTLLQHGISATWYHAGLDPQVKEQRQNDWQSDSVRVMVATNAFGMGIDKPDVRVVLHTDCPSSIEAYFQEAGRAGRDGKKSYAVMICNKQDESRLKKRISDTFPEKEYIRNVYEHLAYFFQIGVNSGSGHTFEFNIDKFCATYKFFPIQVDAALIILQRAGYIQYEQNPETKARVMFLLGRDDLYRLNNATPKENTVITALLRNYGGLFTDYNYIDESYVAQEAGLDRNQTYMVLKNLSSKHIIRFIPRRSIPTITYEEDRIDAQDIILSKDVYENRKSEFEKRIYSVIEYMKNDHICRSQQLLSYFGEAKPERCGICDVCIEDNNTDDNINAKKYILDLLSDQKKHLITELKNTYFPESEIHSALEELLSEEKIRMDGSYILLLSGT